MRTALDLPHGLHDGVPESVYHARVRGLASKGALELVLRSLAHYKAWLDGVQKDETEALTFGRAFHCAILEPERFAAEYVVEPDFGDCRFKEAKASRDAWRKEHEGISRMSFADHRDCLGMARAIRAHSRASKLLVGGRAEVTARWRDEDTHVECKARADYYRPDLCTLIDVKTTVDARESSFKWDVLKYGYHRQDAFYRAGFTAAGAPVEHFAFVAVEKIAPYPVVVHYLDADFVADGHADIRDAIEQLADALEEDVWPAYPEEIRELSNPRRRAA